VAERRNDKEMWEGEKRKLGENFGLGLTSPLSPLCP